MPHRALSLGFSSQLREISGEVGRARTQQPTLPAAGGTWWSIQQPTANYQLGRSYTTPGGSTFFSVKNQIENILGLARHPGL